MNVNQTVNEKLKRKQRKKRIRRVIITLLVIILALAAIFFYFAGKTAKQVAYRSYNASTGTITNAISLTGNLEAVDSETATASSSATVREVYVKEGDMVRDGDKLLMMSNGQRVTASFDGKVNQVYVEKDDKVKAGDNLVQVVDFNHLKVQVKVDEYDINDVYVGQECRIVTTASGENYTSSIASINYVSSSGGNVAYYTATSYVECDGTVYPGMQISMSIPKSEAVGVVVMKMDAIQFDPQNKAYVLMKNENGEYVPKYIETGVSNGNYVEITSGLSDGDEVFAPVKERDEMAEMIAGMMAGNDDSHGGKRGDDRGDFGGAPGAPSGMGGGPAGN